MGKLYIPTLIFNQSISAHQSSRPAMDDFNHSIKNLTIMQPRFTLKNWVSLSRKLPMLFVLFCLFAGSGVTNAQPYINGPLSTGATATGGTAAPVGFTWSEVQPGNVNAGFTNSVTNGFSLADNFTVPSGQSWSLSKFTAYAYSTGYAGATSPYTVIRVQIFNTNPSIGSPAPIFGDLTTNRFSASSTASMYRIFNATPGTTRQIWKIEATVNTVLPSGSYWIEWQLENGLASNFSPAKTVVGVQGQAGDNAIQHSVGANTWAACLDGAVPQDLPFQLDYSLSCASTTPAAAPVISPLPPSVCNGSSATLSVVGGGLNAAQDWKWYTGSAGGTLVGTGSSITVTPAATTTYYVRGEGGCASGPGAVTTRTLTVTPCTCLTPDAATICAGTVQPLTVTPTGATTQTFTSAAAVTIPAAGTGTGAGAPANPYPSTINVAALPTAGVTVQSVTLSGFTHTWASDVDIVLVSPTGQRVILLSDVGGTGSVSGLNFVLSDAALANLSATALSSGTYKPTNLVGTIGNEPDNFPAPGPGAVTQPTPLLSSFTGDPNGNWSLYATDDGGGDVGSLSGFSITFRIAPVATWTPITGLFTNPAGTTPYVAGTALSTVYASPAATTTYTANITAGPCAGNNNVTVTVQANPTLVVTPNPGGCAPVTLTASGASTYTWSPSTGLNTTSGATVVSTPSADITYSVLGVAANGCQATTTVPVKGISTAATMTFSLSPVTIFSQDWTVAIPLPAGWNQQNLSDPGGTTNWFQGNTAVFPAQSGAATSYIAANFQNTTTAGPGTISDWLFTPNVTLTNGDVFTFWTRTTDGTFPDRLQVRMSTNGNSANVGATNASVGDFTNLLLDINPGLTGTGYPVAWQQFTVTISGLASPTSGRLAFRYFVTNGGGGDNSDFIGVDNVVYARPPSAICANTTNNIIVTITGGASPYTLVYTNGTTNTTFAGYTSGTPIQVSPAVTTTYSIVSVTGANGCPGTGNTGTATVTITPPPSITAQPQSTAACAGGNASFTVTAGPVGSTYQWQESTNGGVSYANITNGGVYGGATSATLTLTGVTVGMNSYRYRVVVTGACPPTTVTSSAAILTVNTPPVIGTQPANVTACDGANATFSVVATGNGPTYQWQVSTDGGITYANVNNATGSSLTFAAGLAQNGYRYRVIVTVAPCAAVTSSAAILTVTPLPVVTITSADLLITPGQTTTISASSTPAAASYSWSLNGSTVAGATASSIAVNIDGVGTYQATVLSTNGCSNKSNTLVIGSEASDRLWIYPNPTAGRFQVRLYYNSTYAEKRVVTVYNQLGQVITSKQFNLNSGSAPYLSMFFDVTNVPAGTYTVKVADHFTGKVVAGQLIVQ